MSHSLTKKREYWARFHALLWSRASAHSAALLHSSPARWTHHSAARTSAPRANAPGCLCCGSVAAPATECGDKEERERGQTVATLARQCPTALS